MMRPGSKENFPHFSQLGKGKSRTPLRKYQEVKDDPRSNSKSPIKNLDIEESCPSQKRLPEKDGHFLTPTRNNVIKEDQDSRGRRQFNLKLKNIDSMNDKISDLLSFVKNTKNQKSKNPRIADENVSSFVFQAQKSDRPPQFHKKQCKKAEIKHTESCNEDYVLELRKNYELDPKTQNKRAKFHHDQPNQNAKKRVDEEEYIWKHSFQRNQSNRSKQKYNASQKQHPSIKSNLISHTDEELNLKTTNRRQKKNYLEMLNKKMEENQMIERESTNYKKPFNLKIFPITFESNGNSQRKVNCKEEVCKKLSHQLSRQISLDQELRSVMVEFANLKKQAKWIELSEVLKANGFYLSLEKTERLFEIKNSETDPFENSQSKGDIIKNLVHRFVEAQEFWNKHLKKELSKQELIESGFHPSDLDLEQKGVLGIEDLICFINLHSNNFFRNRDLSCFVKRLGRINPKGKFEVSYEEFFSLICH